MAIQLPLLSVSVLVTVGGNEGNVAPLTTSQEDFCPHLGLPETLLRGGNTRGVGQLHQLPQREDPGGEDALLPQRDLQTGRSGKTFPLVDGRPILFEGV